MERAKTEVVKTDQQQRVAGRGEPIAEVEKTQRALKSQKLLPEGKADQIPKQKSQQRSQEVAKSLEQTHLKAIAESKVASQKKSNIKILKK